jgi:hypothetical protein
MIFYFRIVGLNRDLVPPMRQKVYDEMRKLYLIIALLMASATGYCQQYVTEEFLRGRMVCQKPLLYPENPRTYQSSPVVLSVSIDKEGKLTDTKFLSGHPLLNKSATDYLHGCKSNPLLDGEGAKEMSGIIAIWYDLGRDKPIYGVDLPLIKVLGKDSFEIEGEALNRDRLILWLDSRQIKKTRSIVHLLVKQDPPDEIMKLLLKSGARNIFIHYE